MRTPSLSGGSTELLLCVLLVGWEPLDHHVVSHVHAYCYRYLVNRFDFNATFGIAATAIAAAHKTGRDDGGKTGYPYLINHPDKCGEGGGGGGVGDERDRVLLLLFVKSSPENSAQRRAIRDTWGNESAARGGLGERVRVLFALGAHPEPGAARLRVQGDLLREDRAHGDLIQQDFADTFHNLTAKLVLQFHWARRHCPRARFLMSADDDVFVHVPNLLRYLRGLLGSPGGGRGLWAGHVHRGAPPNRRRSSKYHVPRRLYPLPCYPDYTAGAGYVVSGDVAARIHGAALTLRSSMYIDDVFMGMCASVAGVSPLDHAYFSGEGKALQHPCVFDRMITSHGHRADMYALWRATAERERSRGARGPLGDAYCAAARAALLCRPHYQSTYSCMAAFT